MYAEGPAIALLVLACFLLARDSEKVNNSNKLLMKSSGIGIILGLSAYFRSPFDLMINGTLFTLIFLSIFKRFRKVHSLNSMKLLIITIVYNLLTFPWRLFVSDKFNLPIYSWTGLGSDSSSAYIPNNQLIQNGQEAWAHGNMNWVCELTPSLCGSTVKGSFNLIWIAISNFPDFLNLRLPMLFRTLGVAGTELYPFQAKISLLQATFSSVIILLSLWLIIHKIFTRKARTYDFFVALNICLGLAIIILTHFENRYFLPIICLSVQYVIINFSKQDILHSGQQA
jgi:hypothetical protein